MVARHRRASEGGLQPGQPAVGGWEADRADPVGADSPSHESRRDGRRGSAGGAAGAALWIPGVAGRSVDGGVAGAAGAELVHVGDSDDHRPGVTQSEVGTRLPRHRGSEHLRRAEALGTPGQRPLVLDHDRDPVKRPPRRGREHFARALGECLDDRIDGWVALLDPCQGERRAARRDRDLRRRSPRLARAGPDPARSRQLRRPGEVRAALRCDLAEVEREELPNTGPKELVGGADHGKIDLVGLDLKRGEAGWDEFICAV